MYRVGAIYLEIRVDILILKFKFKIRNCKIQNLNFQVDKDDKDTVDMAISLSSVKMNELEISQNIEKIPKTNTSLRGCSITNTNWKSNHKK